MCTIRQSKIPMISVTGSITHKKCVDLPQRLVGPVQVFMECDCRVESVIVCSFSTAKIGGERFTCGDVLCVGKRCGSVVTMVSDGKSVCGIVKKIYRVTCSCDYFFDFVVVT